jgi:hypothetical protein
MQFAVIGFMLWSVAQTQKSRRCKKMSRLINNIAVVHVLLIDVRMHASCRQERRGREGGGVGGGNVIDFAVT